MSVVGPARALNRSVAIDAKRSSAGVPKMKDRLSAGFLTNGAS